MRVHRPSLPDILVAIGYGLIIFIVLFAVDLMEGRG